MLPLLTATAGLSAALVKLVAQFWEAHVRPPSSERLTATAPCGRGHSDEGEVNFAIRAEGDGRVSSVDAAGIAVDVGL